MIILFIRNNNYLNNINQTIKSINGICTREALQRRPKRPHRYPITHKSRTRFVWTAAITKLGLQRFLFTTFPTVKHFVSLSIVLSISIIYPRPWTDRVHPLVNNMNIMWLLIFQRKQRYRCDILSIFEMVLFNFKVDYLLDMT